MLINYKNEMLHDSASPAYRDPAEALRAGQRVTLRFRTRLSSVGAVYLTLLSEGFRRDYPMQAEDGIYSATIDAPDRPDVYWYYFNVGVDGKVYYYGAEGGQTAGLGCVYTEPPPAFQLTVYAADFATPDWLKNSVVYQIFPDRFARSDDDTAARGVEYHISKGRRAMLHARWDEPPRYRPLPGEQDYDPCDYFGGTLKGIEQSLDYLKGLGVGAIYLNPVFEAASNHRYNTADYLRIDPVLGDEDDLRSLCEKAAAKGMRVILDGVFSHTGSDSVYFNREGAYGGGGAYRSPESPYYPWYTFEHYPDKYNCWWGFKTLPEVNEHNLDWQRFVVTGEDSVMKHWVRAGASGYRLDVADELPDEFIAMIRKTLKKNDPDSLLIGEVWEDASSKISYGVRRRYLFGDELDSVMNYTFRKEIIEFVKRPDSERFWGEVMPIVENCPKQMLDLMMNPLSTHDTARIITAVALDAGGDREWQSRQRLDRDDYLRSVELVKMAFALCFTLPGIPCVYYGDEIGMEGMGDPFNRAFYRWDDGDANLRAFVQSLSRARASRSVFAEGELLPLDAGKECVAFLRRGRSQPVLAAINRGCDPVTLEVFGKRRVIPPWTSSIIDV